MCSLSVCVSVFPILHQLNIRKPSTNFCTYYHHHYITFYPNLFRMFVRVRCDVFFFFFVSHYTVLQSVLSFILQCCQSVLIIIHYTVLQSVLSSFIIQCCQSVVQIATQHFTHNKLVNVQRVVIVVVIDVASSLSHQYIFRLYKNK